LFQRTIKLKKEQGGYVVQIDPVTPSVEAVPFTFSMDHIEKIKDFHKEVATLCDVHCSNPVFGVDYKTVDRAPSMAQFKVIVRGNSQANITVKKHELRMSQPSYAKLPS
jgi:hypothetical protein